MLNKKKIWLGALALALAGAGAALAGCSSQTESDAEDTAAQATTEADYQSYENYETYAPEVVELEDGTLIQRTPSEDVVSGTIYGSYSFNTPEPYNNVPYNTYFLDADNRGCNACHDDLAQTLDDSPYMHVSLSNNLGIDITVQMCLDCHDFGWGYQANQNSFGTLIHGIHSVDSTAAANSSDGEGANMDCWSCHVATGSGDGMQLWDVEKHNQLRGITGVANVVADEFTWDQDTTVAAEDIFDFNWQYCDLDYVRYHNTQDGVELDQDLFDTWTITVTGAVDQELTFTLPELIETYDSVEIPLTMHCTYNPTGGPLINNSVYTGIPLSEILADAGLTEDAAGIGPASPDGTCNPYTLSTVEEAYIVYEIDGEPLPWSQGYPCQLITPGTGAPSCTKEIADIIVMTEDEVSAYHEWNGWPVETDGGGDYYTEGNWPFNDSNGYTNKPNVGIFNFHEGTIVTTGEPVTISGYAAAWDENIVAMEFSMDGGATWTRYETPDANPDNWVNWHFTWTPTEDSAYVLSVRSVSESGAVTPEPLEVMFNAHADGK